MGDRWRGSDRAAHGGAVCPHCLGAVPFDTDDLAAICMCGIDWLTYAPFPKADLSSGEWDTIRSLLMLRSGGRCEVTGQHLYAGRWSVHHRLARGMGGNDRPDIHSLANLVVVTGDGTTGVHGWIEAHREQAYDLGWLVRREGGQSPDQVPLVLYGGRRVLLNPTQPFYEAAPGPVYTDLPVPVIAA